VTTRTQVSDNVINVTVRKKHAVYQLQ